MGNNKFSFSYLVPLYLGVTLSIMSKKNTYRVDHMVRNTPSLIRHIMSWVPIKRGRKKVHVRIRTYYQRKQNWILLLVLEWD